MQHLTTEELTAGVDHVISSPKDQGTIELIVRRPTSDAREVLDTAELVVGQGVAGDNYLERGSTQTADGLSHPEAQLNLMNSRAIDLVAAGLRERWPLAGDQFFVDFDLSVGNLPTGTRLAIGTATIEVSAKPHTGCAKFSKRFGIDAAKWVNSSSEHRFRGINAMVVEPGVVRSGDSIRKLD